MEYELKINDIVFIENKRFIIKRQSVEPFYTLQERPLRN